MRVWQSCSLLDAMCYEAGIDLDALLMIASKLPQIVGYGLPGKVFKTNRIHNLHPSTPSQ